MDSVTEQFVRRRAQHRCEYCRLPEQVTRLKFQIDHVIARQHGDAEELENLARGRAFFDGTRAVLVAPTSMARATIVVLAMNHFLQLSTSEALIAEGRFRFE